MVKFMICNKKYFWLIGVFLLFFFASYASAQVVDRIVAVVNTEIIMLSELNNELTPWFKKIDESNISAEAGLEQKYQVREQILEKMIHDILTKQECERLKVIVSDKDVDNHIEKFKQASSLTDESLRKTLENDGLTMESLRSRIHDGIMLTKLRTRQVNSKIVITDTEIKDFYNEHIDEFAGHKRYHLYYILMPLSPAAPQAQKDHAALVFDRILTMHRAGESFLYLIDKVSEPSMKGAGGDLGFFTLDEMTENLASIISGMEPGQVTPIMEVGQGLQIVWIEDIKNVGGQTLPEATPKIQMFLYSQKVDEKYAKWMSDLKEKAYIKIIR